MTQKFIIIIYFLTFYLSGCSVPQNAPTDFSNSACGSCYWNGKDRDASYQKRPSPAERDWNNVLSTVHLPNISGSGTGLLHPLVDVDRF